MSHTMISAAVLLASMAAASAIFRPPFLPVFGPRPIVPVFGPRPLLPLLGRPFLPFVPLKRPFVPRFQSRQRRRRVSQQVNQVASVGSSGRTRPFVPQMNAKPAGTLDMPRDGVTVNLIDGRDTTGPNVYLVDYGRDGFFDGGMDVTLGGLGGLNIDPGLGLSGMDLNGGFLREDRFNSGDISIDGNVYISGNSKGVGGAVAGAPLGAPMGAPVASALGGVSATDVFDYGLSSMPLDPANMALNTAPQAAGVPLV